MGFIRELKEVRAHGTTKLHVIHTNDLRKVEAIIDQYEQHLQIQRKEIVGVDVEYTYEAAHKKKAALIQLSIGKTQPVLLFQLSATQQRCTVFDNFLLDQRYTFAGFSINRDIEKLHRVGLHIAHFVDIQKEWRVPGSTKHMDSLGDISSMLIDDYYMSMKQKLTNEDHKRWACMPLSMKHV
ncbi:putative exonuclease mut-7-like protein [Hordeum vulgare]|nr:putative exonuclease mut-7-like protein [Hordeum vulgare]